VVDVTDTEKKRPWWRRNRPLLSLLAVVVIAGGTYLLLGGHSGTPVKQVSLSVALNDVNAGKVTSAKIDDQANTVTLTLKDAHRKVYASYPFAYSADLTKALLAKHVKTETGKPTASNPFMGMLLAYGPVLLIIGFLLYLVNSGKLTGSVGKFSGRRGQQLGEVPSERFADVAGCDEAITELQELVEFLKDGERFTALGAKPPRGALLVGPPGTGKTLLARAVAGEAGVPFFPVAGSDFVETFVGVGAKRARDLFDKARSAGKAIIFIDEIDAVGRARGGKGPSHGGESERENTLVSMLNEMDGFHARNVIVLAATNRPDVLDEALVRPGRLDRQIQVPNPDRRGRTAILRVHTRGKPVAADVNLVSVARQTPGMSGAELAQVVNEACMDAARAGKSEVDMAAFQSAIATVAIGKERTSALVTEHDRQITAWHEAGHTVAALLQPDADDPVSVTIVPRGVSGGTTWMSGNDNVYLHRKAALAQLTTALAGRAAEQALFDGEYTQGASGDLAAATDLARKMVTEYGMTDFGYVQLDADTLRMGGEVAMRAHEQMNQLLSDAHLRAEALLAENRPLLTLVAQALLAEETLSVDRIRELRDQVEAEVTERPNITAA